MDEGFCICERWIVEVEPGISAHEDDMLTCVPTEPLGVSYLDEAV
jgi:hypothetical protein